MAAKNQKKEIIMLAVIGIIFLGVMGYLFGGKLLPKPIAGEVPDLGDPIVIPSTAQYQPLLERDDYKALRRNGDVPVKPLTGGGNRDLFESLIEVAE